MSNTRKIRPGASIRTRQRASLARRGDPCHICRKPIDYTLPATHPMAFQLDHIIPLSRGGSDRPENHAASHALCNKSKGSKLNHASITAAARGGRAMQRIPRSYALVRPIIGWNLDHEAGLIDAAELEARTDITIQVLAKEITHAEYRSAMQGLDKAHGTP